MPITFPFENSACDLIVWSRQSQNLRSHVRNNRSRVQFHSCLLAWHNYYVWIFWKLQFEVLPIMAHIRQLLSLAGYFKTVLNWIIAKALSNVLSSKPWWTNNEQVVLTVIGHFQIHFSLYFKGEYEFGIIHIESKTNYQNSLNLSFWHRKL